MMRGFKEEKRRTKIAELLSVVKKRELPLAREEFSISELMDAMIRFQHSRVLYVINEKGQLRGKVVLGTLVRHVFSRSYEPKIHPRSLASVITAETAKDIMQKKPVFASEQEEFGTVLKRMIESNVEEIPILDGEKKVVGDINMIDLFGFLLNFRED